MGEANRVNRRNSNTADLLDQLHEVHYLPCVHVVSTTGWPHQSPPPGAGEVNTADTGNNVRRVACSLQHESQCFKYSHDDRVKDIYENTIRQIK